MDSHTGRARPAAYSFWISEYEVRIRDLSYGEVKRELRFYELFSLRLFS
jgi:hypothetical protein